MAGFCYKSVATTLSHIVHIVAIMAIVVTTMIVLARDTGPESLVMGMPEPSVDMDTLVVLHPHYKKTLDNTNHHLRQRTDIESDSGC